MKITCTNGNSRNGISGSRVTVWNAAGEVVDRFEVPKRAGHVYCENHPGGRYGKRFAKAVEDAK